VTEFLLSRLEGVKSRLVDWSIELEKQGILGENMSFKDEEKAIAKNVTINVGNMTGGFIGDPSHSNVEVHSYGSVLSLLESSAVPKDEKDHLRQILTELQHAAPEKRPGLRDKIAAWLTKNGAFVGEMLGGVLKSMLPPQ
jgi:hypothetical protein